MVLFLKLVLIIHIFPIFCSSKPNSLKTNFVCLHEEFCYFKIEVDCHPNKIYLSHSDICTNELDRRLIFDYEVLIRGLSRFYLLRASIFPQQTDKKDNYLCADCKTKVYPSVVGKVKFIDMKSYYTIDDNNDLSLVIESPPSEKINLLVSNTVLYNNKNQVGYPFQKCDEKYISYADLNVPIDGKKSFYGVFAFLHFYELSDSLTYFDMIKAFNKNIISSFQYKVLEKNIIVEIKLENFWFDKSDRDTSDEKIFLSVQSTEDIEGYESRCGASNLKWQLLKIPYHLTDKGDLVTILLPRSLYGKSVRICASFIDGKVESYKIPLYSFEVNDKSNLQLKNLYYANPLGMFNILFSSYFHPLSEVKLVHVCDLEERSIIPRSLLNLERCSKTGEHKLGYCKTENKYNPNTSYTPEELYLSIYNENLFCSSIVPHKNTYLPFKSTLLKSVMRWYNKTLFLPRLYSEPFLPYLILVCDRWKHPFCLTDEEFDDPFGLIYPSNKFIAEIKSSWQFEDMSLEIKTIYPQKHVIKLITSKSLDYTDYQSSCKNKSGYYVDLSSVKKEKEWIYHIHTYVFKGLSPGIMYYICLLNKGNQIEEDGFLNEIHQSQRELLGGMLSYDVNSQMSWDFIGISNTHSLFIGSRITFNKVSDNNDLLFPTTGFIKDPKLSGLFFSNEYKLDCRTLSISGTIPIKPSPNEYAQLVSFVNHNFEYATNHTTGSRLPGGFWLSFKSQYWKSLGKYLSYSGYFNPPENLYKLCVCLERACYFTGNALYSTVESFDLMQFLKINDWFEKITTGRYTCLYNMRRIVCFPYNDNFKTSLKRQIELEVAEIPIYQATFDEQMSLLLVVSSNSIYVYEPDLISKLVIKGFKNVRMVFSFSKVTFIISSDEINALIDRMTISHIVNENINNDKFVVSNKVENIPDVNENAIVVNIPITESTGTIYFTQKDENYFCFLIDRNVLKVYKIEIDFVKKTCEVTEICGFNLHKDLPGITQGLVLRVSKRRFLDKDLFTIFISHHEIDEVKIYYLEDEKIRFYMSLMVIPGMNDFVPTKTGIITLNSNIYAGEFSQYVFQVYYQNPLNLSFEYPKISELLYGRHYSFSPVISSSLPLKFYVSEKEIEEGQLAEPLGETGFSLNRSTGVISGDSGFVGKYEFTVHAKSLMGSYSITIKLESTCDIGYEPDATSKKCLKCPKGFYRNILSQKICERCIDYLPNSTTRGEGTTSPLGCLCEPGYYPMNNLCVECPPGTYKDDLESQTCSGRCPENQISTVIGASSFEQLKCVCIKGYYLKDGRCEKCEVSSFCPGENVVYKCPENTTTMEMGSTSEKDCLCIEGYELIDRRCVPCDIFSYKPTVGNQSCIPCLSTGSEDTKLFAKSPGSTSSEECKNCSPGYYFTGTGCSRCPENSFCKGLDFEPVSCGPNSILKGMGTRQADCLCPKGFGFSTTGITASNSRRCTKCPINTFQPVDGTRGSCIPCPLNTYTISQGSTSIDDCISVPGYYRLDPNHSLEAKRSVNKNKVNNSVSEQTNVKCFKVSGISMGSNVIFTKDIGSCIDECSLSPQCRYIFYHRLTGVENLNYCSLLTGFSKRLPESIKLGVNKDMDEKQGISKYILFSGPVFCEIEKDRVYPLFMLCPRNYYCPGGVEAQIFRCPAHSVTLFEGASTIDSCLCLPGYYPSNNFCVPCKKGHYKPTISNSKCKQCPENTTTASDGSFFIRQCACSMNMYAVDLEKSEPAPVQNRLMAVKPVEEIKVNESVGIDELLSENIKSLVNSKLEFKCKNCLYGYLCKGLWIFPRVHMPPVPCFKGSSVPPLENVNSIYSCLCNPGYGTRYKTDNYDPGFGRECQLCLPGTYKKIHQNSPCNEYCPSNSTSPLGSQSINKCLCIPGFYSEIVNGNFECNPCDHFSICHGGMENGVHTKPYTKRGVALIDPSELTNESKDITLYKQNSSIKYPCANPDRCIGGGKCSVGSSGLMCSLCDSGYEVDYFNSKCSSCSNELTKLFIPRFILYTSLVLISTYNNYANDKFDLSIMTLLKILYNYTFSLIPLALIPSDSKSSIRKFHDFYMKFFYSLIRIYDYTDRINCFREMVVYAIRILRLAGLKVDFVIPDDYTHIWYIQKILGIFKIIIDIMCILTINFILYLVKILFFNFERPYLKRLAELSVTITDAQNSLSTIHAERNPTPKRQYSKGSVLQQVILLFFLYIPTIFMNSLSMIWCAKFIPNDRYVLLQMPTQECNTKNKLFFTGRMVSISSMGVSLLIILIISIKLMRNKYNNGSTNIFTTGYKTNYRTWDIFTLMKQILITYIIVCRNSIEVNNSDYIKIILYTMLNSAYYLTLLRDPYKSRSGSLFLILDKYTIISIVMISCFLCGSYFFDLSRIAGLPFIISSIPYLFIIITFIKEIISISSIRSGLVFAKTIVSIFKIIFKYPNSFLSLNHADDIFFFDVKNTKKSHGQKGSCKFFWMKRYQNFLLNCISDMFHYIFKINIRLKSEDYYFYIKLIFWHCRCMNINIFKKAVTKKEIINYVTYLYYFEPRYKNIAKSILLEYPLNRLRSHCSIYHPLSKCDGNCNEFRYNSLDNSMAQISTSLLVDLLFENFYTERPISILQFYYSINSITRMDKSDINKIHDVYIKHLHCVRNNEDFIRENKIESTSREINKLELYLSNDHQYGPTFVKYIEVCEQIEALNRENHKQSEIAEFMGVTLIRKENNFRRSFRIVANANLKKAKKLTNQDILESIRKKETREKNEINSQDEKKNKISKVLN